jgi:hypothetical protein
MDRKTWMAKHGSQHMDRNTLIGMTIGAAVMFGFGTIWVLLGLFRGRSSAIWVRFTLLFAAIALALCIAAIGKRASSNPQTEVRVSQQQAAADHEIGRRFYIVAGIEFAAIFASVIVLRVLGFPDYILCAIALIVGIHFFPLAALFKAPIYYGTGLLGSAISLVGFFTADSGLRQKVVGLSFGLVLWATAAWLILAALAAAPMS